MSRPPLPATRSMAGATIPALAGVLALAAVLDLAALPAAALAQGTAEQQRACAPDAMRLCMGTIPDVPKTTACMKAHVAELSPRCRTVFFAATGGAPAPDKTASEKAARSVPAKSRVAAREEQHAPRRATEAATASRAAPSSRRPRVQARAEPRFEPREAPRHEIRAELPERAYPQVAPDEPTVAMSRRPGIAAAQANILSSCRAGLIDPFTCSNTIRTFGLDER